MSLAENDRNFVEISGFYLPSWKFIKANCFFLEKRIRKEFKKRKGLIPYSPGFVYLIHAIGTNYYKIGRTTNPDRRITEISPKMPFDVRVIKIWYSLFAPEAEASLHRQNSKSRVNGEWFELTDHQLWLTLGDSSDDELLYAYASSWVPIIYGINEEDFIGDSEAKVIAQNIPNSKKDWLDILLVFGYPSQKAINAAEYYFNQIILEEIDSEVPQDIQRRVKRVEQSILNLHQQVQVEGEING